MFFSHRIQAQQRWLKPDLPIKQVHGYTLKRDKIMFTLSLTDSLCRYQCLDREILTTKFAPNCGFVIPRKGYFIKRELYSSPKGQEFDQKIAKTRKKRKIKCYNYARNPSPLCPNIDTYINGDMLCIQPLSLETEDFTVCDGIKKDQSLKEDKTVL